ncbi:MAG: tRNA pseudouridine(38-40) synthase TruA, partial [Mycobacterium sp.]
MPRRPRRRQPRRKRRKRKRWPFPRLRNPTSKLTPTSPEDPVDVPATGDGGGRVRLRLEIAYDGTEFAGWAVQAGQRTVA